MKAKSAARSDLTLSEKDVVRMNEALSRAEKMAHLGAWEIEFADTRNIDSNPLRWSDEVYRIFGYAPGAIHPTNELFFTHVHADDRQAIRNAVTQALAEKRPYLIEHRIIRPNGEERTVQEFAEVTFDKHDQPLRIVGAVQDITDRKRMEQALRRQAALIDLSPDAIMCRKEDGTITFWSRGAEKLYGWSASEAVGQTINSLLKTVFREPYDRIEETLRKRGQWTGELVKSARDGRSITVESRWLYEPGTHELMVSDVDITERKKSEQRLEQSLKEKELLLKELNHRVKNNMQIISSMLRLQSRSVDDQTARSMLEECQTRIRSMSLIHEQLYSTDSLTQIFQRPYIERLTQNLLRSYASREGRIHIDLQVEPDLSLDLDTAIPCGLIVNELVSNALKYAFTGMTDGTVHIHLQRLDDRKYRLVISDNGVGLPRGFDSSQSQTLGLQLVHSLVGDLHGTLHIDTPPGTTFTITFSGARYRKRI